MKKKLIAMVLSLAMSCSLIACGGSSESSDTTDTADTTETETTEEAASDTDASEASAAETSDSATDVKFDELQHLVIAFPTWTGAPADTDMVVEELNKILVDRYNIEIEMQIGDSGSYNQSMTLALSGGQQVDVISTLFVGYSNLVNQGYLLDLEEDGLLENYGQGIVEAIGQDYVDMCRVGGVLYGITNNRDFASGKGCIAIASEYLETIGYEVPSSDVNIVEISDEELEDILAQLHEAYPDMEVYRPAANDLVQQTSIDQIGGNNFGVILNYGEEAVVENLFTSDEYKEFCTKVYNWNQAGYISKDAATDTTAVGSLMKDGIILTYGTSGKPGSRVQESLGDARDMTIFQTKQDYMGASSVASYPWAIPYTTANPEAAMTLMKALYTDEDIADLFNYGIEGVHFEYTEDGFIDTSLGTSSGNYGLLAWLYPNQFLTTPTVGNPSDLWDQVKKFNDESLKSVAAGFAFDSTPVANEIAACTNIYNEYKNQLEYGFLDPETGIETLNQKLMDAGMQKIIDEKQSQLDAYMASK
ncbi:MAG: ABC transporter substrate-binding protein [Butyrivibrio sp.]|nr:ABC transporter substrate-binding protein [Butyrivibrio sp.]